jgi:hypothetical protein
VAPQQQQHGNGLLACSRVGAGGVQGKGNPFQIVKWAGLLYYSFSEFKIFFTLESMLCNVHGTCLVG